jgi:FixJ family two-component response regulator
LLQKKVLMTSFAAKDDTVVYLVEDDELVRAALSSLVRSAGYRVEAFESPADFLDQHRHDADGCLVLDVWLPGMNGLEVQRTLRSGGNLIPIIFVTAQGDIPMTVRAMKGGAVEFLPKPVDGEKLLGAVSHALHSIQTSRFRTREIESLRARCASLTARERQVMAGIVDGKRNKQVAAELGVSEITVKIHRRHVMKKMSAASLAELVLMVARMSAAELRPWTDVMAELPSGRNPGARAQIRGVRRRTRGDR